MPLETLPDWLAHQAAARPRRVAVRAGAEAWTFAELDRRATACARRLASLGIAPGHRVAALMRNGLPFVELAFALMRARAVLVPLNTRLAPSELAWQLADSRPALLVYDPDLEPLAEAAAAALPGLPLVSSAGLASLREAPLPLPPARIAPDEPHAVVYTSGTTGRPKGAVLTYGNHFWNAVGALLRLGVQADDCWLACLPLFHVGGLAILLRAVLAGFSVLVHPRFDAAAVNRAIDGEGVTVVSLVATMLQRILADRGDRPFPPRLRCVLVGGGPVPEPLLRRALDAGAPVVQTYGLTEAASQVCTLPPEDALRKPGSAGKPIFPVEVRVAADGRDCRPGEVGEILVRGPTVTPGYLNRPEETARALRDGWLHTGDLGYLDDEGYLYVVDRRADLIVSGGENVYPAEVEAALLEHPDVAEACVIGLPDPEWGQVPAAAVVARPGAHLEPDALKAFLRARLAGYKVPREIRVVPQLPYSAAGKLLRERVRSQWPPGPRPPQAP